MDFESSNKIYWEALYEKWDILKSPSVLWIVSVSSDIERKWQENLYLIFQPLLLSEDLVPNFQLLKLSISSSVWKELNHVPIHTLSQLDFLFVFSCTSTWSRKQVLTLPACQPYPPMYSSFLHLGKRTGKNWTCFLHRY